MRTLDNITAAGHDDNKGTPIIAVADPMCSALAYMCYTVFEAGIFPESMKKQGLSPFIQGVFQQRQQMLPSFRSFFVFKST